MGPWQFQMKHKQRVTHPQEVCGLARARDARVWLVLCVGRPPCPGVISANGMLDLDDLGPAGNQSDAPWQRKTRRAQTYPRSPRICVQYGWCDVSADATLPLRRCRGGDLATYTGQHAGHVQHAVPVEGQRGAGRGGGIATEAGCRQAGPAGCRPGAHASRNGRHGHLCSRADGDGWDGWTKVVRVCQGEGGQHKVQR